MAVVKPEVCCNTVLKVLNVFIEFEVGYVTIKRQAKFGLQFCSIYMGPLLLALVQWLEIVLGLTPKIKDNSQYKVL